VRPVPLGRGVTARRAGVALVLAVLLVAVLAPAGSRPSAARRAAAQPPITVVLDGEPLTLDAPPIQVAGRVLVPLRGIFERLGASVSFDPLAQTVTARRGTVVIVLRLGSREARVGDRIVTLDVPALALQGRTMVPLRFLSEALGARVDWEEGTRTVRIYTTPLPPSPGASPRPGPGTARTVQGTLLRVELTQNRLQVLEGTVVHLVVVTAETAIFRRETTSGVGGSANLRELRPGDQIVAEVRDGGEAVTVRAFYRQVRGVVETIALRTITLQGLGAFTLHLEVAVSGRARSRDEVRPGMTVVLRLNPQTNIVWEITVE